MENEVKKFLETMTAFMGDKAPEKCVYGSMYEFVLVNGRAYDPPKDGPGMMNGECFKNAADMAVGNPRMTYVEGFATTGMLPVFHAWCVDEDGNVVDPTWGTKGTAYFGVPFPTKYLTHVLCSRGYYGVIDAWLGDGDPWPLLSGKHGYNKGEVVYEGRSAHA